MNLVGKILTVVNLLLAMLFFAFAGATLNGNTKVRNQIAGLKAAADKANSAKNAADDKANAAAAEAKSVALKLDETGKKLVFREGDASKQQESLRDETNDLRKQVAVTNTRLLNATEESVFRKQEVDEHRKIEADLNKKLKDLGKDLSDTRDQLSLAKNDVEILKDKYRTIQGNEQALWRILADKGIAVPNDPKELEAKIAGNLPAPEVEGKITKVDGKLATIDLGENDGLKPGMKFDAWRQTPQPKYLGEVTVFSVDPKRAVVTGLGLVAPLEAGDNIGKTLLFR